MARRVLGGRTSRTRRKQRRRTGAYAGALRPPHTRHRLARRTPASRTRQTAAAALAAQRLAIARELHDGAAQEVAFLAGQLRRLAPRPGEEQLVSNLEAAAQRALLELRRAVDGLRDEQQAPLAELAERTIASFEERCDVVVERDIAATVAAEPERGAAIVRILSEALSNAAAHGSARRVRVRLRSGERRELTLRVADDGAGFDVAPDAPAPAPAVSSLGSGQDSAPPLSGRRRWGLITMRERTELLGGRFAVSSRRGEGTEVVVVLP